MAGRVFVRRGFPVVLSGFLLCLAMLSLSSCVTDDSAPKLHTNVNEAESSLVSSYDGESEEVSANSLTDICYDAIAGDIHAQYLVGRYYMNARDDSSLWPKGEQAQPSARVNYTALAMIWLDRAIMGGNNEARAMRRSLGGALDDSVFQAYQELSHMKDDLPCELHEINNPFFNISPLE